MRSLFVLPRPVLPGYNFLPMLLNLLCVASFFGLALLAAITISANRKAVERKRRKKIAQGIRQCLQDRAIAS